nr:hypothetical protein [Endozoicomonas sp.]
MQKTLTPNCAKCRKKPMVADGFCMTCWYPGIDQDWNGYQIDLDNQHDHPTNPKEDKTNATTQRQPDAAQRGN